MTPEESKRLNEVCAEALALRAMVAALIASHPDPNALLYYMRQHRGDTIDSLYDGGATGMDMFLTLAKRKMDTFFHLVEGSGPQTK